MDDPLPAAPLSLVRFTSPVADYFSLRTLPLHIHEIFGSFTVYCLTHRYLAPYLSSRLFPDRYSRLPDRTKQNWNVRVVSFVQAAFVSGAAIFVLFSDDNRRAWDWRQRLWGYSGIVGLLQACSTGYFLWDIGVSVKHIDMYGGGALAHATSALAMSLLGFRPFVNYYGLNYLLYQLSTPFLNIHWWLDKLGKTGSRVQWLNGVVLISTFGGSRILWGYYTSYHLFQDMWKAWTAPDGERVPRWLAVTYVGGVAVLNVLNAFWFTRMVQTVRSRFREEAPDDKED